MDKEIWKDIAGIALLALSSTVMECFNRLALCPQLSVTLNLR